MTEESLLSRETQALLAGDVADVARRLLGCRLSTDFDGAPTTVVVDEVEAYGGADDPASHAYRGRTKRNASMFGVAGTLYVYRSYGVHWCANIVTGPEYEPSAVLLRGGVAVVGADIMQGRRGRHDHVTDGPGKLCTALGITGQDDGTSIADGPVRLIPGAIPQGTVVVAGPRIGISREVDRPWRFIARSADGSSLNDI